MNPEGLLTDRFQLIIWRGLQRGHRQPLGEKTKRATAPHTMHVLKINDVPAIRAVEFLHGTTIP
ncbi:protein of unknown function [Candidatus Filomicrobium marinum]|uniref:Uncharacterized protein n=1 Tax=Candidatus Filomicrobium marinum TaxID=1608628 RepID=A0A0D6JGK4_9HYPH|nr:protein of unknown function [Candidatus Filomicrobium marinum]